MENISRSLAKPVVTFERPKPVKRPKRWTVLFVGSYGKTVRIKWFRGLVMMALFILGIAIASNIGLFMMYQLQKQEGYRLQRELNSAKEQLKPLQLEKEKLMAMLIGSGIPVEDTSKKIPAPEPQKIPDTPIVTNAKPQLPVSIVKTEPATDQTLVPDTQIQNSEPENTISENVPQDTPPVPVEPEKPDPGLVVIDKPVIREVSSTKRIAASELNATYKRSKKTIEIQFDLNNVDPNLEPVSGYIFLFLKTSDNNPKKWMALPNVNIANEKPGTPDKGQYFSISRFKVVQFETERLNNPEQYTVATVFVFDKDSELLLEKDFPIELH